MRKKRKWKEKGKGKGKGRGKGNNKGVKIGSHLWIEVETTNNEKKRKFGIKGQFFFN